MEFADLTSEIFSAKIIFFIIICCFILILNLRKRRNIPPGPNIFQGSLNLFKPDAFRYLFELIKQYGPIVELSILGKPLIILGNYDTIKEAFVKNDDYFLDRPSTCLIQEYCENKGIIFSTGEFWKEQRKFAMSHLIRSGFQKSYDNIILAEVELGINEIQERHSKSFDPKSLIIQMTRNIIMKMAASERCDYKNKADIIQTCMDEIVQNMRLTNPVNFFPPLKYIFKSHKNYKKCIQKLRDYMMFLIKEHEISFDENNLRDYIDAFILKMYEEEKNGKSKTTFTRKQLIISLTDFILAGSETASATLLFAIVYLLHYPNIQTKIQKEIDDVIGSSRYPVMADCSKMPFTYATILETQRCSSVLPLAIGRQAKKNIKIEGYEIPKGAYVLPIIYSMHFDPEYWNDPLKFDPERFLNKKGESRIKSFEPFFTGLIFSNGESWKEQKKFAISHLIKSGLQESYDNIILHELELAYNEINKYNGKSFDPRHLIVQMTTNIIMLMAASERFDYNENLDLIHENMDEIVYNFRMSNPVNFFPPLKHILKSHKQFKKCNQNLRHYLMNIINEHEKSFDPTNLKDYIDAFLLKMYEEQNKGNSKTSFTKEYLIANLMDFILAGSETSSFTLLFAIIYLLHHPHIQTKIQKEIDDVIGSSRNPIWTDCPNLPFTHATILEAQRYSSVSPLAAARTVTADIKIQGYDIPKGAYVLPHLYAMHFDPKYWKNPQNFDPNHFLDKNGEVIKNIKSFWPFATGHRECMGESLARKELFLIFTSLLQRYSFKSTEPELPSMTECTEGAALTPLPFKVFFIAR